MAKAAHIDTGCTEWSELWEKEDISRLDYLSQVILNEIKSIVKDFRSRDVAELGSGTGRISRAISQDGGNTTLLDKCEDVLRRSKAEFTGEPANVNFIVGAFPDIPIKTGRFDMVWNAGVMEHFTGEILKQSILEMVRVCKTSGTIITINPYKKSWLHNIGKNFMMLFPSFPYRDEYPIDTLKAVLSDTGTDVIIREYSSGFFALFAGVFKRLSLFSYIRSISLCVFWALNNTLCGLDRSFAGPVFRSIDKFLSKIFGGYLLVSVIRQSKITEG